MALYTKNEKLSELITDKRVVLVGPAPYLVGKNLGQVINGYDTVCRVNYMAPSIYLSDYGDRTDIMFYNCATLSLEQMEQHLRDNPDFAAKLKLVVCPVVKALGKDPWTSWNSDFVSPVVANFESINIYNNDFYWIGIDNYKHLFDMINCREPNSGILAMAIILKYRPKEFFVTGFSFYADAGESYFNNYATRAKNWKGTPGHPQKEQQVFFKRKVLSKIRIDSYLNALLKLSHKNVHNL